ncbi:hypothetical protein ABFX02_12G095200 [Erythranthe guttata]
MAVFAVGLVFLLAFAGYSDASYCVCNNGLSDAVLQKNIDYACGAGADCSAILQSGPCFNPNTVKDHCNYAVNSYYQRKGQIPGSCDFQATASVSTVAPSTTSGCVYQSTPSTGGTTTPVVGGTPAIGGTPAVGGTPAFGGTPAVGGTPTMGGTPMTPTMGGGTTNPGSTMTPGFGLGPTGSGFSNTDSSGGAKVVLSRSGGTFAVLGLILITAIRV